MRTGEDARPSVLLLPIAECLDWEGVHLVVNDYLAKRDAEWMGHIYTGLTVGVIVNAVVLQSAERRLPPIEPISPTAPTANSLRLPPA